MPYPGQTGSTSTTGPGDAAGPSGGANPQTGGGAAQGTPTTTQAIAPLRASIVTLMTRAVAAETRVQRLEGLYQARQITVGQLNTQLAGLQTRLNAATAALGAGGASAAHIYQDSVDDAANALSVNRIQNEVDSVGQRLVVQNEVDPVSQRLVVQVQRPSRY
jgi:hypothetical protein